MKHYTRKIIPFISIIFGSFSSFSQITITAANMPSAGDTIRYSEVQNSTGINYKATGENKVWDFTTLKQTSQALYEYKISATTPYIFNFGLGAIGLKIADSLGTGQMSFNDVYSFFKKSTAKWEAVGIGFKLSAVPIPQAGKHTNTDEIYTFPLNYKDRDSTMFALKVPIAVVVSIGIYFQDGNRVNTVDGWGKISTPYQSNVDCIRIKSVITETDSLALEITGQAPINFAFPNNRVEYKWLSKTEKIPMLEVTGTELGGTFTPTIVRYRDNYRSNNNVSIKTFSNSRLEAYPNPAKNSVTIETPGFINHSLKLFVFDMSGKQILNMDYSLNENDFINLNTSNLSSGKYSVIINTGTSVHYTSVTIFK